MRGSAAGNAGAVTWLAYAGSTRVIGRGRLRITDPDIIQKILDRPLNLLSDKPNSLYASRSSLLP
jgi:hypothetical protein